ncbi:MAG: competence protein ComK [Bacilli bacterium]
MDNYEICEETLAILPMNNYKSKIIERDREIVINKTPYEIIDNSCQYFGSSFSGRVIGTKKLIGVTHKAPVIIEESREIIFFPTNSPKRYECCWVSLNNISKYYKETNKGVILFDSGYLLNLAISYGSLDNQILRAARLESELRKRKSKKRLQA